MNRESPSGDRYPRAASSVGRSSSPAKVLRRSVIAPSSRVRAVPSGGVPVRLLRGGREEHVNWGQGLKVAGRNPVYWARRPRFELKP